MPPPKSKVWTYYSVNPSLVKVETQPI